MPPHIRRGNAGRSSVRAAIEHIFAHQKGPLGLCIRTIGIARAG
jgi:transposase, IS5 family